MAITRARRHLAVVADSETVSHDSFLKSLMEYMTNEGEVRSAHEYMHDALATVEASTYNFKHHEVFLTERSRDGKKRKGLEANKGVTKECNTKQGVDINAVGDIEDKARKSEDKIGTRSKGDSSSSSHASVVSAESSVFKEDNSEISQRLHKPFSSNATVAARYSRETLEKEIVNFTLDESKIELPFPKTLNSQQRFDVHSIAEKLGLNHESRGEGKDRYIAVSKPKPLSKGL